MAAVAVIDYLRGTDMIDLTDTQALLEAAKDGDQPLAFERWSPTFPTVLHPHVLAGDEVYTDLVYGTPGKLVMTVFDPDCGEDMDRAEMHEDHVRRVMEEINGSAEDL